MSGIKTLLEDGATGVDDFDLGESFGRYARGIELLPLLKLARVEVKTLIKQWEVLDMHVGAPVTFNQVVATLKKLEAAIADIEQPPEEAPAEPVGELSSVVDVPF